ncbi:RrF2 family transcriptional regulator [Paenibacillus senegalimassiliensis]|uniref:RrF2 family transcriptional regulator n=1 Tax=Paenibacillus senegalimassiliensis TaxID=1737426 RepID=UPI00073E72AD|nr:Rrf2 family transcriptional regulator [Paenibacillus senegalimassiliensis]
MQFSKSTDYALHALLYLARTERRQNVGIKELSAVLGVSESYLSKIMSKLRQDGVVRAAPGVNGGYELSKAPEEISFLEVIQVIEGRQHLFECSNSSSQQHRSEVGTDRPAKRDGCVIEEVMIGAEQHLYQYLREHTLQSALDKVAQRV